MVKGGNGEGYEHALLNVFEDSKDSLPTKGALAKARQKVSWGFFKDRLNKLIVPLQPFRKTWNGFVVYAIDGQQLTLPRTKDIVEAGYSGRAVSQWRESYMPKAFLTHAYDVLSSVTKDLRFHPRLNEQSDARSMLRRFEKNSLTLYDRLYFSRKMVLAHLSAGNHFLMRCRKNASLEILELLKSSKRRSQMAIDGQVIQLVKAKNPKTGKDDVFATNLPLHLTRATQITELYRLRWGVETSFSELTGTCKLEQWHSKSLNGIKQELYALFWLINYAKISLLAERAEKRRSPLSRRYKKANFKLVFNYIADRMPKITEQPQQFKSRLRELIRVSTQLRKARTRAYPRQIRSPRSPYPYRNTRWHFDP